MKWKEFKDILESQGVNDSTEIWEICWYDKLFRDNPKVCKKGNAISII